MDIEIKRDYYLEQLIRRQNNGLVKVITGIRRCGKSFIHGRWSRSKMKGSTISCWMKSRCWENL